MIRGLPVYILEQDIIDNILTHGLEPKEVRLIRKKDTGESRGFAFVEFSSVDEASEWIEENQGILKFGTWRVTMQFSQSQQEDIRREPVRQQTDWKCKKCDIQNFKRREACFKCGARRPEIEVPAALLEEEDESSPHPSKVLLFTNLDPLTVEDTVWDTATNSSKQPIKNVTIPRDKLTGMSRGVAHVEMHSIMDAMLLYRRLTEYSINVDGRKLIVAYKRQDKKVVDVEDGESEVDILEERKKIGLKSFSEEEITKMAEFSADLYAKHPAERASFIEYYEKYYREGGDPTPALKAIYGNEKKPLHKKNNLAANAVGGGSAMGSMAAASAALEQMANDLGTVVVEGVQYKVYPPPDTRKYQYDESSGYYYDPVSTLYYDANSQYYYNSKTQSFCYWDAQHQTFLPAPTDDPQNKQEQGDGQKKEKVKDKVKTAKKIQKDMEKWAKQLNQKKVNPAQPQTPTPAAPPDTADDNSGGMSDVAFSILQKKNIQAMAVEQGIETDDLAVIEAQFSDWVNFTCQLCKRAFPSKDKLMKHNSVSDLHKQNVANWRQEQLEKRVANSGGGYRDRAAERRNKYGVVDEAPQNKFREKYNRVMDHLAVKDTSNSEAKIGDDNVGNKMLQKMGWKAGAGLGKNQQGMTDIINTDNARTNTSGLGNKQTKLRGKDDYRDAAKATLFSRFNER